MNFDLSAALSRGIQSGTSLGSLFTSSLNSLNSQNRNSQLLAQQEFENQLRLGEASRDTTRTIFNSELASLRTLADLKIRKDKNELDSKLLGVKLDQARFDLTSSQEEAQRRRDQEAADQAFLDSLLTGSFDPSIGEPLPPPLPPSDGAIPGSGIGSDLQGGPPQDPASTLGAGVVTPSTPDVNPVGAFPEAPPNPGRADAPAIPTIPDSQLPTGTPSLPEEPVSTVQEEGTIASPKRDQLNSVIDSNTLKIGESFDEISRLQSQVREAQRVNSPKSRAAVSSLETRIRAEQSKVRALESDNVRQERGLVELDKIEADRAAGRKAEAERREKALIAREKREREDQLRREKNEREDRIRREENERDDRIRAEKNQGQVQSETASIGAGEVIFDFEGGLETTGEGDLNGRVTEFFGLNQKDDGQNFTNVLNTLRTKGEAAARNQAWGILVKEAKADGFTSANDSRNALFVGIRHHRGATGATRILRDFVGDTEGKLSRRNLIEAAEDKFSTGEGATVNRDWVIARNKEERRILASKHTPGTEEYDKRLETINNLQPRFRREFTDLIFPTSETAQGRQNTSPSNRPSLGRFFDVNN